MPRSSQYKSEASVFCIKGRRGWCRSTFATSRRERPGDYNSREISKELRKNKSGPKKLPKDLRLKKKRKGFQCNQTPASSSSSFPSRLQKCQRYWNYIHWSNRRFLKVFNFQFPHFSCFSCIRSRMISRWMSFDKRFSFKSSPREWKMRSRVQGSQFYWTFFCCCIFKIFFVKRSKQKGGIKI